MQRSGLLLRQLIAELPEHAPLAEELAACEREGDRITHDIIHRLNGARRRVRAPFDAGDGYVLATALDDIVDHTEQAAAQLGLYGVEAPMEQAVEFADVLVAAGEPILAGAALPEHRRGPHPVPGRDPSLWRTRATACCATASPRCSPGAPTRWS